MNFSRKITSMRKGFYKDVDKNFAIKVSNMIDIKRRKEDFPSPARIKELKSCRVKKISNLKDIMESCNEIVNKKENLFRKLTKIDLAPGSTRDVQDPRLSVNSIFMTRQKLKEHMDILKSLSTEKFNRIIEYN
jgi:hypothetical protein